MNIFSRPVRSRIGHPSEKFLASKFCADSHGYFTGPHSAISSAHNLMDSNDTRAVASLSSARKRFVEERCLRLGPGMRWEMGKAASNFRLRSLRVGKCIKFKSRCLIVNGILFQEVG